MYGATAGKVAVNKIPLTTNQACCNLEIDENIAHYRYIYHLLSSKYKYLKSLGRGSQSNISASIIKKQEIQIPNIELQHKLANVLDNFNSICSNLQIGLPAEINARNRQYEYYRDQLLTFTETGKPIVDTRERERAE